MGYSFWLAARVLLYALSHSYYSTYHGLYYTSGGALAGMRNSSMGEEKGGRGSKGGTTCTGWYKGVRAVQPESVAGGGLLAQWSNTLHTAINRVHPPPPPPLLPSSRPWQGAPPCCRRPWSRRGASCWDTASWSAHSASSPPSERDICSRH